MIRSDPNRTIIPAMAVDAVVHAPFGAHPSFVQGSYDRDNTFYRQWSGISKDPESLRSWLQEWVLDLSGPADYIAKLGPERLDALRPTPAPSLPVDYGSAP